MSLEIRENSRKKIYNVIDPVYLFLDLIAFEGLFKPKKQGSPGEFETLESAEVEFLLENLQKHRFILWINLLVAVYLGLWGLDLIVVEDSDYDVVVAGLLAPAMVTGGAWFTVTFGGIPEKFISIALVLTFWMFTAFSLSMTLLIALLCSLTPWPVAVFVLIPIYIGLYLASMLYDNVDGLKIGLDSTLLKFSRATLNYYQKHGLVTSSETQKEAYNNSMEQGDANQIATFTNCINLFKSNLSQLEAFNSKGSSPENKNDNSRITNHLVASSMDLIFKIVDLPYQLKIDKGNEVEFDEYVLKASEKPQDDVDQLTTKYLHKVLIRLNHLFDNNKGARSEVDSAKATLEHFEKLLVNGVDLELADFLFSQVFKKLLSLMESHRHAFLGRKEHENNG